MNTLKFKRFNYFITYLRGVVVKQVKIWFLNINHRRKTYDFIRVHQHKKTTLDEWNLQTIAITSRRHNYLKR